MLDVLVDYADAQGLDEHVLVFVDNGSVEAAEVWNRLCLMVHRLPAGQDFCLTRADAVRPCCVGGPGMDHFYDGMVQEHLDGSDDVLDFVREFIASKRRISFVQRTKAGK